MDNIDLASRAIGETGQPIVILHGLLGSSRNWATHAKWLGETHQAFALDLRNHGTSPWADDMNYEAMADDVRSFIKARGLGPVIMIGHSMGGKTAMRLALNEPSLVEKLVVVDIAPVAYDHSFGGYVEAMLAIDVANLTHRKEIDDILAVTVPEPAIRAFLLQNLERRGQGFAWKANLAVLAKAMPGLMNFPVRDGDHFANPSIFLAGANSNYVRTSDQPVIERLFSRAEIRHIADAGHWLHAEQPAAFSAHLQDFLKG